MNKLVSVKLSVTFEPRDLWVGVFWQRKDHIDLTYSYQIYICFVPCLPIVLTIKKDLLR